MNPLKFADYFRKISTLELVWGFIRNISNRPSRNRMRKLRQPR
jgi:hypothetical protein